MAKYNNISLLSIIEDYLDFSGHEGELDETWVLKQANDAVSRIVTDQQLVHEIALLDVRDYKAELPSQMRYVVQAAAKEDAKYPSSREEVSQYVQKVFGTDCEFEINLNCKQCGNTGCSCDTNVLEVDVNRIYETAHPELFTQYMSHFYRSGGNTGRGTKSYYHPEFLLMRKTSNNFFNVPYHINECLNLGIESVYEYDIKMPNIVVNFKQGQILLAYMATPTDKDGYRLIPDVEVVFQAINYYIEERMAFRNYRSSKTQNDRAFWQEMFQLKEKMIKRARITLQIPSEDEWWQFVKNHWTKVVPYYKWEQNFNRGLPDQFRYPDQTTNIKGYVGPGNRRTL